MTLPYRGLARAARRPWLLALPLVAALTLASPPAGAEDPRSVLLDLPLYDPASGRTTVPGYAAHKLELRLAAAAAREARPLGEGARLGVASLDAALGEVGAVRVEREFAAAAAARAPGEADEELARYYIVHLAPDADLAQALAALRRESAVENADPIGIFPVTFVPNDSLFPQQYGFFQANGLHSHLPEAWDLATGDSTVIVAILDTGLQWNHPDLGGPAPYTGGSIWHNWLEMAGTGGVDDDANGYIDDFRGWDFVTGVTGKAGEDLNLTDNDPKDFVGHGTFVAGVAGAIVNNMSGVAGAGNGIKLMPVRVGWHDGVNPGGVVDMSFCAQAVDYARQNGAHILNCSWSNGNLNGLGTAVTAAIAAGASVVVAAGNFGDSLMTLNYLASRGDCVDVASLDSQDVRSSFSSYGQWVEVSAAGSTVPSTYSNQYSPTYLYGSGTSFSAPLVSGILGLYQSWRLSEGLALATPLEVRLRVRDTADPVDAANPTIPGRLGGGRVNALRMMTDPPTSFQVAIGAAAGGAPAFVEWPGGTAVVMGGVGTGLLAWDAVTAAPHPGWPILAGKAFRTDPAVFDLDFDGDLEVIAGADDGNLYAVGADGSAAPGFPRALGGPVRTGPSLGDVSGGPEFEIVAGVSTTGDLYVVDAVGQTVPGWPVVLPGPLSRRPAVFDLDGDSKAEVVIGTFDSTLCVLHGNGTLATGWPVGLGGVATGSPTLGDLDNDGFLDVVVGATDQMVYAFSRDGDPLAGWPVATGGSVMGGVALADLDGDNLLEVVVPQENSRVTAWNHDGTPLAGWPYLTQNAVRGDPIVFDADGDGSLDVAFGSFEGRLHVVRANGSALPSWPRRPHVSLIRSATAGDPDGDGRLEIAIGGEEGRLLVQDMGPGSYDASRLPWHTAGRAYTRHGATGLPTIDAPPPGAAPLLTLRLGPNPSHGRARAELRRGPASGAEARFRLVDAAGRLRRRETVPFDAGGSAFWWLEDRDQDGRLLPPGLYFVVADSGAERAVGRWVLLR